MSKRSRDDDTSSGESSDGDDDFFVDSSSGGDDDDDDNDNPSPAAAVPSESDEEDESLHSEAEEEEEEGGDGALVIRRKSDTEVVYEIGGGGGGDQQRQITAVMLQKIASCVEPDTYYGVVHRSAVKTVGNALLRRIVSSSAPSGSGIVVIGDSTAEVFRVYLSRLIYNLATTAYVNTFLGGRAKVTRDAVIAASASRQILRQNCLGVVASSIASKGSTTPPSASPGGGGSETKQQPSVTKKRCIRMLGFDGEYADNPDGVKAAAAATTTTTSVCGPGFFVDARFFSKSK